MRSGDDSNELSLVLEKLFLVFIARTILLVNNKPKMEESEMKTESFEGKICEVNMESPGGWMYNEMVDSGYRLAWSRIKKETGIEVELDFDYIPRAHVGLADLLLGASQRSATNCDHFIALVTEKRPKKGQEDENSSFVRYLEAERKVNAVLATFDQVKSVEGEILVEGRVPTVIYLDANLSDIDLEKYWPIAEAARRPGLVVNPRGMGPLGEKGLFAMMSEERFLSRILSSSTAKRIPKTFFLGQDTVEFAWKNRKGLIFKPTSGHSGNGFYDGHGITVSDFEGVLRSGTRYIAQEKIDSDIHSMEMPALDLIDKRIVMERFLTDIRVLVGKGKVLGCFCRFNKKPPVNLGAGGGGQALAMVFSSHSPREATSLINKAICSMTFDQVYSIVKDMAEMAMDLGFIYKDRAVPISLTPRVISKRQLEELWCFGGNLWIDLVRMESLYRDGLLDEYTSKLSDKESEIIKGSPWNGSPAIIGADGMFGF